VDGVGPSRQCYVDCTRKCFPACNGKTTAEGTFDVAPQDGDQAMAMEAMAGNKKDMAELASMLGVKADI